MNIKDVTTTSFGLVVAYLLPGLAGLYTISLYVKDVGNLLVHPNDVVGFLLLVMAALLVGVFVHGIHLLLCLNVKWSRGSAWMRFDYKDENNKEYYFKKIKDSDKLACFMAVLDEYYRVHQFFGGIWLILPFMYIGWVLTGDLSTLRNVLLGLLMTAATVTSFFAARETWKLYVEVGHKILEDA
jgi:hypothetical protein